MEETWRTLQDLLLWGVSSDLGKCEKSNLGKFLRSGEMPFCLLHDLMGKKVFQPAMTTQKYNFTIKEHLNNEFICIEEVKTWIFLSTPPQPGIC